MFFLNILLRIPQICLEVNILSGEQLLTTAAEKILCVGLRIANNHRRPVGISCDTIDINIHFNRAKIDLDLVGCR